MVSKNKKVYLGEPSKKDVDEGVYVATTGLITKNNIASRKDNTICYGNDPIAVHEKAKELGRKDPVIFFVSNRPFIGVAV